MSGAKRIWAHRALMRYLRLEEGIGGVRTNGERIDALWYAWIKNGKPAGTAFWQRLDSLPFIRTIQDKGAVGSRRQITLEQ